MRNQTLMQTIAWANRVFPGKHSGSSANPPRTYPCWWSSSDSGIATSMALVDVLLAIAGASL